MECRHGICNSSIKSVVLQLPVRVNRYVSLAMGAYSSNFVVESGQQIKNLKPTNPQWIFRHAEVCDVPFSDVLRCWRRFTLLGANKKGILTQQSSIWQSEDKFVQQILRQLPWNKNGQLTFQVYLKVCFWFQNTEPTVKLKVAYGLLNNGQPVTSEILQRVLKHVYQGIEQEELQRMADNLITQADVENDGHVDEEHFVEFAKKIPFREFAPILRFSIIPLDMLDFPPQEV